MKKIIYFLTFLALNSSLYFSAVANAAENGKIKGMVVDAATSEPLIGASVGIEGTSFGAATNLDGEYIIHGVPAGVYTVYFRYLGYKDLDKANIQLDAGQTVVLNVSLSPQSIVTEEVVVSAQARGQMAAMNQQRTSNTIVDIVSSARIQEVPDVNAAEAIGRLPGVSLKRSGGEGSKVVVRGLSPKYSIIQVDGVRMTGVDMDRSVGLSAITAEMIDGIELTKSLTPDKDADAIGGIINLRTKVADSGFHVNTYAQGGYNNLEQNFGNYKYTLGLGNRFFEDKLGMQLNAGLERVIRSNDLFEAEYSSIPTVLEGDSLKTNIANIKERKSIRKRKFGSLVMDYKTDFMSIKFNNIVNQMINENETRHHRYRFNENDFIFRISDNTPNEIIRTHALSSDFNILSTKLHIDLSYTNTKLEKTEDEYEFIEEKPLNDEYQSIWEGDKFFALPSDLIDKYYGLTSPDFAYLESDIRDTILRKDATKTANINWSVPYSIKDKISGYIKVGVKYSQKERSSDKESYESYYHGGLGTNSRKPRVYEQFPELLTRDDIDGYYANIGIPALNFYDPDYDYGDILNGRHELGWSADLDRLKEVHNYSLYPADQVYRLGVESAEDDYSNLEKMKAGYLMAEINIGKRIMILPGIRYEDMHTEYTANYIREDPFAQDGLVIGYPIPVSVTDRNNRHWFPSVNTKIEVNEAFDIRAAYYKSCSRPDYRSLSPGLISNNDRKQITAYNAFLLPSIGQNYDLGFSFFNHKVGLISFNLFYKEMSDLIYEIPNYYSEYFDNLVGAPDGFIESLQKPRELYDSLLINETGSEIEDYPVNNPNMTKFRGFEVSWQTNLWYLKNPILKGLVFNLNYSRIWSETKFPYLEVITTFSDDFIPIVTNTPYYRTRTGRMLDQPTTLLNVSIGWDYRGFSSRISFRYQGETINGIDPIDDLQDEKTADIFAVDLKLKQKIMKGLSVSLEISNITQYVDESYYLANYYLGQIKMPKKSEFYGLTSQLGLRYTF